MRTPLAAELHDIVGSNLTHRAKVFAIPASLNDSYEYESARLKSKVKRAGRGPERSIEDWISRYIRLTMG